MSHLLLLILASSPDKLLESWPLAEGLGDKSRPVDSVWEHGPSLAQWFSFLRLQSSWR
jgi:hypothetical protein